MISIVFIGEVFSLFSVLMIEIGFVFKPQPTAVYSDCCTVMLCKGGQPQLRAVV